MMKEIQFNYQSLKQCVKDYLKEQMEGGTLNPGERIDEKDLREKLNVSRTPIREALIELETEGFVEIIPRKHIIVKKLTEKEIHDMFQMIGTLEAEAAASVAARLTDEEYARFERLFQEMTASHERGDFKEYCNLNIAIHGFFIEAYGNDIFKKTIGQLKERLWEFPKILMDIPEWEKILIEDHRKLLELFKKRDSEGVRRLLKDKHWNYKRNSSFLKQVFSLCKIESEIARTSL
jgi:DNA-binding GntR family transcriptional regulator